MLKERKIIYVYMLMGDYLCVYMLMGDYIFFTAYLFAWYLFSVKKS